MKQPHKHADILRAIADGKEVQVKGVYSGKWMDVCCWKERISPFTHDNLEWRIKPEPKPDVVYIRRIGQSIGGDLYMVLPQTCTPNIRFTFDGETGKLKKAEVIE